MRLPERAFQAITDVRVMDPERARQELAGRKRRARLAPDGRLHLLATDHAARGVTVAAPGPGMGMADRRDLLGRIFRIVAGGAVDGVMASMDLIEELAILATLVRAHGGPALLDDLVLIGSVNRGGLHDSAWELDDPITGPTPEECQDAGLDGCKVLLRVNPAVRDSLRTLETVARVVTRANRIGLPTFLEPLPVAGLTGMEVRKTPMELARLVGIASALGDSSRYLWLKLPYCAQFDVVAGATTLPILLLGGPVSGDPAGFLADLTTAMQSPNVRGAMVGRNVLYPGDRDPLEVARAVHERVHGMATPETAPNEAAFRILEAL